MKNNNVLVWVRKRPVLSVLLIGLLWFVLALSHAYLGNPFKATDPSSRFFKAKNFDIHDYPRNLDNALAKLFPIGTDKSFVDFVMYSAGARPNEHRSDLSIVRYDFPQDLKFFLSGYFITVAYDKNFRVLNVYRAGNLEGIHQGQPSLKSSREGDEK